MQSTATGSSASASLDHSLPKWVFLQLLESCNLRCKMCYEWGENGPYNEKKILKQLDIKVVKDIISTCSSVQPYYELYGGEPLLYPHIGEVLKAIHDAGSKVHMPTNGTLLEKHAELLVTYPPERIWVSLDGPIEINDEQRGKGVFQKAVKGIEKLLRLREEAGSKYPQIGISTVVTPRNFRHLERFFFEALDISKLDCISIELQAYITEQNHKDYEGVLRREFGVNSAPVSRGFVCDPAMFADIDAGLIARQIQTIAEYCEVEGKYLNTYPKVMSEDNIRKYFSADWFSMTKVKKRCPFPWVSTEINAQGDVTSCHAYYDLTLGNVNEASIAEIWRGEKYTQYRNYLRKQLLPICQGCCLFYNEKPMMA
ncbi:radical SAM protein [Paenibacillus prosopidis]|uniref:Radical SAM protein with 4Fe4S-binding SPASM domain n=1 Tax=Paenibacillus prosopidis TaxID=630520 RepID=A0A368VR41_9BACL|nr:radical SAM protein [Paenibacillus prosopidis]RCW43485.1 radical SAM protein with 4Fe4S-binding SPASM domain [Paenibacillus prosopidis]